jgi:hypothetical protein
VHKTPGSCRTLSMTITLDWTVECPEWRYPRRELLGKAKLLYDRHLMNASISVPDPPLCDRQYAMTRRSEAKPR